jgi:hydrogenase maturation protease
MSSATLRTYVIGLGNPLMGDDGIGVLAQRSLEAEWTVSEDVHIVDGGTWGMNLLPLIEDAENLLLIDAIERAQAPGALIKLEGDQVPRALAMKISPHEVDLHEVLAVASLRGRLPQRLVAIGLQPERIEFGLPLSPIVERGMSGLVDAVAQQLVGWGHVCRRRLAGPDA